MATTTTTNNYCQLLAWLCLEKEIEVDDYMKHYFCFNPCVKYALYDRARRTNCLLFQQDKFVMNAELGKQLLVDLFEEWKSNPQMFIEETSVDKEIQSRETYAMWICPQLDELCTEMRLIVASTPAYVNDESKQKIVRDLYISFHYD